MREISIRRGVGRALGDWPVFPRGHGTANGSGFGLPDREAFESRQVTRRHPAQKKSKAPSTSLSSSYSAPR